MKQSLYLLSDVRESWPARALKFLPRLIVWLIVLGVFPLSGTACLTSFRYEVLGCKRLAHPGRVRRARENEQLALFPLSGTACPTSIEPEVSGCTNSHPGRAPEKEQAAVRVENVLAYLERAEFKEINPWVRDDLRIAWITVLLASRGEPLPHVTASYRVLGLHPDKVWPAILARRAALLGRAPRKKPPARVTELKAQNQRKG